MKKLFALVLVLCLVFAGCEEAPAPQEPESSQDSAVQEPVEETNKIGSIVHDWYMDKGRVQLFLFDDGTFYYQNYNTTPFTVADGMYSYDEEANLLVIEDLAGERYEGHITVFDELQIENENGFMIFKRERFEAGQEHLPDMTINGTWTLDNGKATLSFEGDSYEYNDLTTTLRGSYVVYESGDTLFVDFDPTGMPFELGTAFFYDEGKSLMTLEGNLVFYPDSPNYYPGSEESSAEENPPASESSSSVNESSESSIPPAESSESSSESYEKGKFDGKWTSDSGKSITFKGENYSYYDGSQTSTGKYDAEYDNAGTYNIYFLTNSSGITLGDAFINYQMMGFQLIETGEYFYPQDLNNHPFVGMGG